MYEIASTARHSLDHLAARSAAAAARRKLHGYCFGQGFNSPRLHQLKMRIFKLKKSHEKSRRYVKQRIYGFSVFSEICTFVQRGVETDDTRRILCLRKLKSSTNKKVRQCDRKTFLTFRFSGSFRYFAVLSGVFNVITYTVSPSVPVRQCDNVTGTIC